MTDQRNKLNKRLLQPVALALLETTPSEDVVAHLKKRLRMPKRLAKSLNEYYQHLRMFQFSLDEELLVHRLSCCPRAGIGRRAWQNCYQSIHAALLDWLAAREENGKLPRLSSPQPQMRRNSEGWPVPAITTLRGLAAFLELTLHQLEGLADLHGLQNRLPSGPRHHYRHRWVNSRHGKVRLLEIPKRRLKEAQRKILHGILDHIPPHACAHGFRAGHSIVSNAASHVRQEVVVSFDLADFFVSVKVERVMAMFRCVGYPRLVARYLAALCTKSTPDEIWRQHPQYAGQPEQWQHLQHWRVRHLPQGAPTSPALANLVAYYLDMRMCFLARQNHYQYTRYADDLTLSGDRSLGRNRLALMTLMETIVREEGFRLNLRKTHLMHRSQRQEVCGIVVNERCNRRRAEFDELKAILHNCKKHGVESQNREQHPAFLEQLRGRLAMLGQVHPERASKLLRTWNTLGASRQS